MFFGRGTHVPDDNRSLRIRNRSDGGVRTNRGRTKVSYGSKVKLNRNGPCLGKSAENVQSVLGMPDDEFVDSAGLAFGSGFVVYSSLSATASFFSPARLLPGFR